MASAKARRKRSGSWLSTAATTIANFVRVLRCAEAVSSAARSVGFAIDQKLIQTTFPRNPTRTSGSDVSRSSNRNAGIIVPIAGGSIGPSGPNLTQAVHTSATLVTNTMTALTRSMRRTGELPSMCISASSPKKSEPHDNNQIDR